MREEGLGQGMQRKMDVLEEESVRMGRIGIRGRRKWGLGREREEGERGFHSRGDLNSGPSGHNTHLSAT